MHLPPAFVMKRAIVADIKYLCSASQYEVLSGHFAAAMFIDPDVLGWSLPGAADVD